MRLGQDLLRFPLLAAQRRVLTSIPDACVKLISSPLIAVSTAEDEAAALGWTPPEFQTLKKKFKKKIQIKPLFWFACFRNDFSLQGAKSLLILAEVEAAF